MRPARVLLAAFALTAAVDLISLAAGSDTGHALAKPFLMPLLAAHAHLRGAPRLLLAALLLGGAGDVLLLSDADPAFLAGMACFAVGHVCYLALFRTYGNQDSTPNATPRARAARSRLAVAYALALGGTLAVLWPGLPAELRIPVAGYSLLLTAMAYRATALGLLAGTGGALFLLSDTLIATGVADLPQLPAPDFWIMLTYVAAQWLLTGGVLAAASTGTRPPLKSSGSAPATR
ncbi:lysoplasmalogenase [Streptomyces turgidiscabies]|uniref:YhhN-like protein n=1 Tax=Streptomyces turgidiscabies (strain Car8) TaxID=698760 RepID=L7FBY0_STRT8|nr:MULTISPECIES: lysoplasmalogenase [Streptomyces]ELP68160.1 YhhN-like protein [Streptomyces turgidiscabies Car8]MDX3498844.1 lysoplasmalogenase [Streptomyces turgidiscabies]GAQ76182.1 YhhN-like protein [Streptomyces turgidiscabies]